MADRVQNQRTSFQLAAASKLIPVRGEVLWFLLCGRAVNLCWYDLRQMKRGRPKAGFKHVQFLCFAYSDLQHLQLYSCDLRHIFNPARYVRSAHDRCRV